MRSFQNLHAEFSGFGSVTMSFSGGIEFRKPRKLCIVIQNIERADGESRN
jgi:hypothetical protein